jgi:hypothetical protein
MSPVTQYGDAAGRVRALRSALERDDLDRVACDSLGLRGRAHPGRIRSDDDYSPGHRMPVVVRISVPARTALVTGVFSAISASFARWSSSTPCKMISRPVHLVFLSDDVGQRDIHPGQRPVLAFGVHPQRDRGAGTEPGQQQAERSRTAAGTAVAGRFVTAQRMTLRVDAHTVRRILTCHRGVGDAVVKVVAHQAIFNR